ncbi:hypothetical protein [Marinactinospora rubrisoli]|uniref:EcsC family protein n=1 Tax=Marinactinospora rubrisoli TaxID=2715399 RepID=A0ABW2KBF8_9ACTN
MSRSAHDDGNSETGPGDGRDRAERPEPGAERTGRTGATPRAPRTGRPSGAALVPAEPGGDEVGDLVARLMSDEGTDKRRRVRLLGRLSRAIAARARAAGARSVAGGRWLTDLFANEIAPRIPVRDRETLIRHHKGLTGEDLADVLERNAVNTTTAVGAAGGALAAVEFTAPPLLLTAPAQIVAETLVVAAVEVKLIGELHEVYGTPAAGNTLQRTSGYLVAWAKKRGIDPLQAEKSITAALGTAARTALRNRLMRLLGRHLTTLGPYLTGAVAGGTLNRAGTRALAAAVRDDLRAAALPEARNVRRIDSVRPASGRVLPRGKDH